VKGIKARSLNCSSPSVDLQLANANWMLSFGDLLTLVLCYFLMMLSSGTLSLKKPPPVERAATVPATRVEDGTYLADLRSTRPMTSKIRQIVPPIAFSSAELRSEVTIRRKIDTALGARHVVGSMAVSACAASPHRPWQISLERLAVIEAATRGMQLRRTLTPLGSHCELLPQGGFSAIVLITDDGMETD
jgi:hypothetical protein